MARAVSVFPAERAEGLTATDTILLDQEQRRMPRGTFKALRGTMVEVALPQGDRLRSGDVLRLDDGSLIEIVAKPEDLLEVRATDRSALARLAWLLGDHHIPVEIHERRLRLHRSDMARALLQPFGPKLLDIEAPFEPEGGAYEAHTHP
ncbi:urease accessory protein UreE [Pseudorhodoplanes sinuspersici]|uniref:Urease accessory protein UreE n=1 Tax=Pseudorhodoplanes sinuspersici TaxID=1235591 RepID=A0A1W6ZWJ2_9HYPH|nr:urease accessory protein UreE [Pseudorhodoplanes sinuspersici]ARQ01135.1 hypothetical protein CAK95_20060 [Pseudorhodoplanes sinuspersici]RKE72785.1 urease accessory protein UreE [Pseudorhodoplanes sinuspersici]